MMKKPKPHLKKSYTFIVSLVLAISTPGLAQYHALTKLPPANQDSSSVLSRPAVNSAHRLPHAAVKLQPFEPASLAAKPPSGFHHDFTQIPVHTAHSSPADSFPLAPPLVRAHLGIQAARPQKAAPEKLKTDYKLGPLIGKGGAGRVYAVADNAKLAIKELKTEELSDKERKEAERAFDFEATTLEKIKHENLLHVESHFEKDGKHYMVMERIEGETLLGHLARTNGPMPESEVLQYADHIGAGLAYLHAHNVIHRDVKPENVMLTKDGRVIVLDLGISRIAKPGQERDTTRLGTPGYAPPEQYGVKQPGETDSQSSPRSDIYALGATLHHLLSNHDPSVDSDGPPTTPLPALRTLNPNVSPQVERAILKATSLRRADRYASIDEFLRDLHGAH